MPKIQIPLTPQLKYESLTLGDYATGEGVYNGVLNAYDKACISPVPGSIASAAASGRTDGWGCYYWDRSASNQQFISVFDYYVYDTTSLSNIANFDTAGDAGGNTTGGRVFFAEGLDGSGNKTLYILAPENGTYGNLFYIVSTASTTVLRVTDAQFPGNASLDLAGGIVGLDGYIFVLTKTGQLWNSDFENGTAWTASNFLTAEMEEDVAVFLAKYKNHLVVFGTRSTEFFYNNGNPTESPLLPRRDISFNVGALAGSSSGRANQHVASAGDTLAWYGNDKAGELGIYIMDNFQPKKVSTPQIDRSINSAVQQSAGELSLQIIQLHGRPFILAHIDPAGTPSYILYDIKGDFWTGVTTQLGAKVHGFAQSYIAADLTNSAYYVKEGSNKLWRLVQETSYDDTNTTTNETKTAVTLYFKSEVLKDYPIHLRKYLNSVHIEVDGFTTSTNSTATYTVQSRSLAGARFADGSNDYFRFGQVSDAFQFTMSFSESTETLSWDNYKIRTIELDLDTSIQT